MVQSLEEKEKDRYIAEQKETITACEEAKLSLVQGLMAVLDQLENIYRYALKNERGSWFEQVQFLWSDTSAILLQQGIVRIEGDNTLFDSRLHSVVQVKEDSNIPDGLILDVLRCGYMYKSRLLRKAQVIVNKNGGGHQGNEQYGRD